MEERLVEKFGDVVVIERIDDGTALALSRDQSEVAQESQLMRTGRLLHAHRFGEFSDGAGPFLEAGKDPQP